MKSTAAPRWNEDLAFVVVILVWCALVTVALLVRAHRSHNETLATLAHYERLKETLLQPRVIAGQTFPAGTWIGWQDEAHQNVWRIELPGPTRAFGGVFAGTLELKDGENRSGESWVGTLAEASVLGGWPCAAGPVVFAPTQQLLECTTSADHDAYGLSVPSGSSFKFRPGGNEDAIVIGVAPGRSIALPGTGLVASGGGELQLHLDGSVNAVYSPGDTPFRGVTFGRLIRWKYPREQEGVNMPNDTVYPPSLGLRGEVTTPILCDGRTVAPAEVDSLYVPWKESTMEITLKAGNTVGCPVMQR